MIHLSFCENTPPSSTRGPPMATFVQCDCPVGQNCLDSDNLTQAVPVLLIFLGLTSISNGSPDPDISTSWNLASSFSLCICWNMSASLKKSCIFIKLLTTQGILTSNEKWDPSAETDSLAVNLTDSRQRVLNLAHAGLGSHQTTEWQGRSSSWDPAQ